MTPEPDKRAMVAADLITKVTIGIFQRQISSHCRTPDPLTCANSSRMRSPDSAQRGGLVESRVSHLKMGDAPVLKSWVARVRHQEDKLSRDRMAH
jgi:hypothetical protein